MIQDDQRQALVSDANTEATTDKQSAAAGRVVGSGVDRRLDILAMCSLCRGRGWIVCVSCCVTVVCARCGGTGMQGMQ